MLSLHAQAAVQIGNDNYNDCTIIATFFFSAFFTRLHVDAFGVVQFVREANGAAEWGAIGRESKKEENAGKKRRRYLVAISWYYLHLPGEMRWLVCSGRHLYPDERNGGQVSSIHT